MIKAETENEDDDHPDDFGSWVETVNPGIFIKVEEDVHQSHRKGAKDAK
jgi:hypothetical protein